MPDATPPSAGAPDGHDIDVGDDAAVHAWAAKFDVSAEQIRDAVQAVGASADDVEMHLKGSRSTTNSDRTADNG